MFCTFHLVYKYFAKGDELNSVSISRGEIQTLVQ